MLNIAKMIFNMTSLDGVNYRAAGPIIEDLATFQPTGSIGSDPLNQFRQDQLYTAPVDDDQFSMFDGYKVYTGTRWPVSTRALPIDDKDWLLDMWDATQAPGVAAILFIKFKEHKLMDYIPAYLSNPAFIADMGSELKTVMRSLLGGKIRNDVMYRYQRLLQTHPIMFETLDWLDDYWKDQFGSKLYRFGIPNALAFIDPKNITADMIHESIENARINADKRIVPPTPNQFIMMYQMLLDHKGHDKVNAAELVRICMLHWGLGFQYIKAKEMSFNDALSIVMTFIYKRGNDVSPYENHDLVERLYNEYGPSDQWPTMHNVIQYVNAVTAGRVEKGTQRPKTGPGSSSLTTANANKYD